jgi:hypothetical protein
MKSKLLKKQSYGVKQSREVVAGEPTIEDLPVPLEKKRNRIIRST